MEKEIEREVLEVESRGKKKKKKRRGWDIGVYVCGAEITREKRRRRRKHMDKRMEILPQYFYNIFTKNFK